MKVRERPWTRWVHTLPNIISVVQSNVTIYRGVDWGNELFPTFFNVNFNIFVLFYRFIRQNILTKLGIKLPINE